MYERCLLPVTSVVPLDGLQIAAISINHVPILRLVLLFPYLQ